jgi:hypothetical protein
MQFSTVMMEQSGGRRFWGWLYADFPFLFHFRMVANRQQPFDVPQFYSYPSLTELGAGAICSRSWQWIMVTMRGMTGWLYAPCQDADAMRRWIRGFPMEPRSYQVG